jgi:hypothetical protein
VKIFTELDRGVFMRKVIVILLIYCDINMCYLNTNALYVSASIVLPVEDQSLESLKDIFDKMYFSIPKNFEVIVIENSTDKEVRKLLDIQAHPQLHVRHESDKRSLEELEKIGLEESIGQYVFFLNPKELSIKIFDNNDTNLTKLSEFPDDFQEFIPSLLSLKNGESFKQISAPQSQRVVKNIKDHSRKSEKLSRSQTKNQNSPKIYFLCILLFLVFLTLILKSFRSRGCVNKCIKKQNLSHF